MENGVILFNSSNTHAVVPRSAIKKKVPLAGPVVRSGCSISVMQSRAVRASNAQPRGQSSAALPKGLIGL